MRALRLASVRALWVFVLAFPSAGSQANEFDWQSLQQRVLKTIDQVRPAVVNISSRGSGFSGVIVSPDGHVLSAAHAVKPGTTYRITLPDGRKYTGIGKGSNSRTDSALIRITEPGDDLPHVPMGDSAKLVPNQPCLGLSYPGGQKPAKAPVARFGRIVRGSRTQAMFQSTALMEPGDSGGPLFDLNGCVIGIHSRIGRSMDRNFEVPVNVFRDFWNEHNREEAFLDAGPPTPKLGVRISVARDEEDKVNGLTITNVFEDSLAEKAGIKNEDRIVKLYDRELKSATDVRTTLIAARDEGAETITAILQREGEELEIEIQFDVDRKGAPEVALPEDDLPENPASIAINELRQMARHFSELESRLDDTCAQITSQSGDKKSRSIGTRILGTHWLIAKSSLVGKAPEISAEGETVSLDVVHRDRENDLVLLKAPEVNNAGVELDGDETDLTVGSFLLTPDDKGAGLVSVVGSSEFRSQKLRSRGYLGVMPATYQENQGAVLNEVVKGGAAERAGLIVGDVITKLDDTDVRTHADMRSFLMKADPSAVITATLTREDEELTKTITLGSVPSNTRHAADQMAKSERRDGFQKVFIHDANLKPNDCGGPLFTLSGEFVGLNIARNSRVRSFALPVSTLRGFMKQATAEAAE